MPKFAVISSLTELVKVPMISEGYFTDKTVIKRPAILPILTPINRMENRHRIYSIPQFPDCAEEFQDTEQNPRCTKKYFKSFKRSTVTSVGHCSNCHY